jgi:hypothetical protein
MGFKDFIRDSIYRIDLLSANATFRTRNQPSYETIFGGLLSIGILGVFYYFLYWQMSDLLNYLTITYDEGLEDDIGSTSAITSFPFAISINGVDLSSSTSMFIIQLWQNKLVSSGGTNTATKTELALAPCQLSDWENYGGYIS